MRACTEWHWGFLFILMAHPREKDTGTHNNEELTKPKNSVWVWQTHGDPASFIYIIHVWGLSNSHCITNHSSLHEWPTWAKKITKGLQHSVNMLGILISCFIWAKQGCRFIFISFICSPTDAHHKRWLKGGCNSEKTCGVCSIFLSCHWHLRPEGKRYRDT